jgi:hypothetical protein
MFVTALLAGGAAAVLLFTHIGEPRAAAAEPQWRARGFRLDAALPPGFAGARAAEGRLSR